MVRGKYSCPTTEYYHSSISVRKIGYTDENLVQQLIEEYYLPLYSNCSKTTTRDEKGKLIAGPIFLEIDSGQGHLCTTFLSLEFRGRMIEKGFYLILGFSNSTLCTQEQDHLYQDFKGITRTKTDKVFCKKLAQ